MKRMNAVALSWYAALLCALLVFDMCAPAEAQSNYTNFGQVPYILGSDTYFLYNNTWGLSHAASPNWSGLTKFNSSDGWGTSFDCTGAGSNAYYVITFPESVIGYWDGHNSSDLNLPQQLNQGKTISCSWSIDDHAAGIHDAILDLWFYTGPNVTSYQDLANVELIVYVEKAPGHIGNKVANITIDGYNCDVYIGQGTNSDNHTAWTVLSYAMTRNQSLLTNMSLSKFIQDGIKRKVIGNAEYLGSIQAGFEVFNGSGYINCSTWHVRFK